MRGSTLVERSKEYVQAARVTGVAPLRIMRSHVLPNVMGPVLVLGGRIQVATAIITEATSVVSRASACRRLRPRWAP